MIQSSQSQPFLRIPALPHGRGRMAAFLALLLGIFAGLAHAQNGFPPNLMSYQGFLVDANGAALAPTTPVNYSVVFRIYSVSSAGTSLWTEAQTVTVDKGNFSVVLGEGGAEGSEPRPVISTVFNSATASDLYLGITVKGLGGNNTEIAPRLRLLTSPYSFLARTANSLAANNGVSLIVSDAGRLRISQALQTTGGNARGDNATDLQVNRSGSSPGQVASGVNSVITGGFNNTASGAHSVVAGGGPNTASGPYSAVGGGGGNLASGEAATIPGGSWLDATGNFSFAAGRRAKARHHGSFVWGDSQDYDKASTGDNQFLVYAGGGMSINAAPASGTALTVSGKVKADTAEFGSMTVTTLTSSSLSGFGTVPLGGIIMWSGSVDSVPSGWALCDSRVVNGRTTPDLRGRFIVGAGPYAQNGLTSRDPNATGGNENTTLTVGQLPAHNHNVSGSTSENGNHNHTLPRNHYDDGNGCCVGDGLQGLWGDSGTISWNGSNRSQDAGNHTHTFNVTSGNAGNGESFSNLPPFYALAFIMRVQ